MLVTESWTHRGQPDAETASSWRRSRDRREETVQTDDNGGSYCMVCSNRIKHKPVQLPTMSSRNPLQWYEVRFNSDWGVGVLKQL